MNNIFMRKRFTFRLSVMLFLLMGAMSGAWAQTGTLVRMETTAESVNIYVTYTGDEIKDATGVILDSGLFTTLYPVDGVVTLSTTGVVSLKELECYDCSLISLDVSSCTELDLLYCDRNNLTSLDVLGCPMLEDLFCDRNNLTSLDVSGCPMLSILGCEDNRLTSLDVSGCPMLLSLYCSNNGLTSLDVSQCLTLRTLYCGYNELTSLNISGCVSLRDLYCSYNALTSLDVSGCTSLGNLYCVENSIASMDVSGCTNLIELYCGDNTMISLNVSGCTNLSELSCGSNDLTTLDVLGCPNLGLLYCSNNNLTSLDVSVCSILENLSCNNNNLTTLNISGCANLMYLFAENQTVEVSSTGGDYLNPIFYTSISGTVQDIRIIETTYAFNEALPTSDDMRVFTIPGTPIYGRIFLLGYESVTSVSLNESSISLEVGNSETLVANLTPTNATNQEVTWSSSNPLVATVSDTGEVYAEAEGTTVITVTTVNGGLTATCDVTVQSVTPPSPVCITEQPQDAIICLGSSHTFEVVATGSDLHYQWYKDDYPIGEAISPEYTINSAQNSDYAIYKVRVSGSVGDFVESTSVTLWVADPLPTDLIFTEYPTIAIIGNTYLLKLSDYTDVTKYSWSFSKEGARFSPEIGFAGENETRATFDYPSFGIGTLKATLEHPCGTREVTQTIEVKYPTGIEDMTVETVKLYPNPTSDVLKISGTKANETLTVFDITGSRKAAYQTQEGITTIDISGFSKGTYLLQYKGISYKVMKK